MTRRQGRNGAARTRLSLPMRTRPLSPATPRPRTRGTRPVLHTAGYTRRRTRRRRMWREVSSVMRVSFTCTTIRCPICIVTRRESLMQGREISYPAVELSYPKTLKPKTMRVNSRIRPRSMYDHVHGQHPPIEVIQSGLGFRV